MTNVLPDIYKGIALFTPGGDLIYAIDPDKQAQWHSHLCFELQKKWGLADLPHFLVPGYTATVEKWLDPHTNKIKTIAEVYPTVQRYIPLLQTIFNLEPSVQWHLAPWQEEYCNRAVIDTYKNHFSKLWSQQNLIIRLDPSSSSQISVDDSNLNSTNLRSDVAQAASEQIGYIFRLFISGSNNTAEQTLGHIHQLLEEGLTSPYTLKVIDICQNPEQALIHQIFVTPTLIRVAPNPIKRIVGQFDDIPRILKIITNV